MDLSLPRLLRLVVGDLRAQLNRMSHMALTLPSPVEVCRWR
ncbi:hypothetical protein [Salinispora arenicola]|nr:hypothetical protein [Salinispora arenicola]